MSFIPQNYHATLVQGLICLQSSLIWNCSNTAYVLIFGSGALVKNLPANAGDTGGAGLIPGSGIYLGVGNGNHSSILAWKIPWTEEPGGPQCGVAESQTRLSTHTFLIRCLWLCERKLAKYWTLRNADWGVLGDDTFKFYGPE